MQPKTKKYCIYDVKDDAVLFEGTFTECSEVMDTMAGNLILTTDIRIAHFRKTLEYKRLHGRM